MYTFAAAAEAAEVLVSVARVVRVESGAGTSSTTCSTFTVWHSAIVVRNS